MSSTQSYKDARFIVDIYPLLDAGPINQIKFLTVSTFVYLESQEYKSPNVTAYGPHFFPSFLVDSLGDGYACPS